MGFITIRKTLILTSGHPVLTRMRATVRGIPVTKHGSDPGWGGTRWAPWSRYKWRPYFYAVIKYFNLSHRSYVINPLTKLGFLGPPGFQGRGDIFFCQLCHCCSSRFPNKSWSWTSRISPGRLTWNLKICHPKRKVVFQPSFFRGYVKLREGMFFWEGKFHWNIILSSASHMQN